MKRFDLPYGSFCLCLTGGQHAAKQFVVIWSQFRGSSLARALGARVVVEFILQITSTILHNTGVLRARPEVACPPTTTGVQAMRDFRLLISNSF